MTTNAELKPIYDAVYSGGSQNFYTVDSFDESLAIHGLCGDLHGKRVLEIGCGEGRLAALVAMSGARLVHAVDYSGAAIDKAQLNFALPNLAFSCGDYRTMGLGEYDVVLMQGVLEHMDDWREALADIVDNRLVSGGFVVTSSPCMVNTRGYIWQALRMLLDVPMSLTDKHVIDPWDVEAFCEERGLPIDWSTIHKQWAAGRVLIKDFRKRLPNALRDAGLSAARVSEFLDWLERAVEEDEPLHGATVIYRIDKP